MSETEPPRPLSVRKSDALARLAKDKDLWISTASRDGVPCMVPLSFFWDGTAIYFSTASKNPTSTNIADNGRARVILGNTRDVVLFDGTAAKLTRAEADAECADEYAVKCGWDPRKSTGYLFFRFTPEHAESWRELNEHADRFLMDNGTWVV